MPIRLTRAVKIIAIACISLFVVQHAVDQFMGGDLLGWLALTPSHFIINHRFWQLFTYPFLHADVMHLALNMMMLVFLGSELEALWGTAFFVRFSVICSTFGGLLYLFLQIFVWGGEGLHVPIVGASGALYGMLVAYGILFGERTLLFMMLFPMKAKHFVWVLAGVEFLSGLFSGRNGLAAAAHLGGMAAGFATLWIRASLSLRRKRRAMDPSFSRGRGFKKKRGAKDTHLKLIVDNDPEAGPDSPDDSDDPDGSGGPKVWH